MLSRSPRGAATATGPERRMHPANASAVIAAIMENRNARTTRTGVIPHNETSPVLHRLWLINRILRHGRARPGMTNATELSHHALTPAPIGQDTPVPPSPQ